MPLTLRNECNRANYTIPVPSEVKADRADALIGIDKNPSRRMKKLGTSTERELVSQVEPDFEFDETRPNVRSSVANAEIRRMVKFRTKRLDRPVTYA